MHKERVSTSLLVVSFLHCIVIILFITTILTVKTSRRMTYRKLPPNNEKGKGCVRRALLLCSCLCVLYQRVSQIPLGNPDRKPDGIPAELRAGGGVVCFAPNWNLLKKGLLMLALLLLVLLLMLLFRGE